MATNPDNANQVNPNPEIQVQDNPTPGNQHQNDQEFRARMDVMETQMTEMMKILQALKNGIEGTSAGNPEVQVTHPPPPFTGPGITSHAYTPGVNSQSYQIEQSPSYGLPPGYTPPNIETNPGGGPPEIVEQRQPATAGPNGATSEPQVQTPNSVITPQRTPPGFTPQLPVDPQTQGPNPRNPTHSHAPHVNPAMVPMFHPYHGMSGFPQNYLTGNPQAGDRLQVLEERMRAMEGSGTRARDAYDLCLVPNVVIPPKFKVPDFDKYRGVTCPKSHLTMYCRKMTAFAQDDKLLIHYFQDSLAGASLNWYMQLEPTHIRCWKDLADAFIKQYQYNADMAPDRTQLQSMTKRDNESFKEYAQRWRALAAQVAPPLIEKELVFMFMETLPLLYYDRLIGSVSSSFSDMVVIGERLENGMRNGKIASNSTGISNQKKPFSGFPKKKEGETNAITEASNPTYPSQTIPFSTQTPSAHPQQTNTNYKPERKHVVFDPIPMTYTNLFNYLISKNLITTRFMKPVQPPFHKSYNPNATCGFHAGAVGHTTEDCKAFKYVVQELIDSKWLTFKQENPNISTNPLPGHGGPTVNAIDDLAKQPLIRSVGRIQTPLEIIHTELCHFGVIIKGCARKDVCTDPHCAGSCEAFEPVLQDLLDRHIIQMGIQEKEENVLTLHSNRGQARDVRGPIEVPYNQNSNSAMVEPKPIVVPIPAPFPYKGNKAVPWNYNVQNPRNTLDITNVAGSSGITRSGRIYTPEVLRGGSSKEDEEIIHKRKGKEQEATEGKKVTDQEINEFMKIMRQSEYKVVDQLNQTPAKISMLSLLLNSEAHRTTLMKVLNEAHVNHDITVGQFDGIVGNVVATNYLTFTDDELPPEGRGHNQALHISVKCGEYALARVLIDNGSSLNVLPKSTMDKLNVDRSYMKPSSTLVRAFDGSKREVLGEVELSLQIGPEVFYVIFQVMDIAPSYSCLLGRPWIHSAGAVPSSLHRRIKFIVDNKLIVIFGEEEMLVNRSPPSRYVEAAEESLETAFQSLEITNAVFTMDGIPPPKPKLSKAALMVAKVMLGKGYQFGNGLGKAEQGILTPLQLHENKDRRGLGYWPNYIDKRRIAEEKRERRLAKFEGREPNRKKILIYDIKRSFRSSGMLNPNQVAAVEDDPSAEVGITNLVRHCPTNEKLNNWEIVDFPVVFSSK